MLAPDLESIRGFTSCLNSVHQQPLWPKCIYLHEGSSNTNRCFSGYPPEGDKQMDFAPRTTLPESSELGQSSIFINAIPQLKIIFFHGPVQIVFNCAIAYSLTGISKVPSCKISTDVKCHPQSPGLSIFLSHLIYFVFVHLLACSVICDSL